MLVLVGAVILSSLVGSLHCVGMCGGFVAFYSAGATGSSRAFAHLAYHGGRLVSYVIAGTAAGAIGSAIDLAGSSAGLSRSAAVIAGVLLALWGLSTLLPHRTKLLFAHFAPNGWKKRVAGVIGKAREAGPTTRAGTIGLLSTLLPCGWLYAFLLTAAGTGSAAMGAVVMLAFWIGSVPALLLLGEGIRRVAAPLRARVPALSAIALVTIGIVQISGRLTPMDFSSLEKSSNEAHATSELERVQNLDSSTMPCCAPEDEDRD